jgi:acetyl-CoA synthetase
MEPCDEVGYYRITGRVDDVVIVQHNLGTAPIEDAINEHPAAEFAIVGFRMTLKEMLCTALLF